MRRRHSVDIGLGNTPLPASGTWGPACAPVGVQARLLQQLAHFELAPPWFTPLQILTNIVLGLRSASQQVYLRALGLSLHEVLSHMPFPSRMYLFHVHDNPGVPLRFTTDTPVQLVVITESLRIFLSPVIYSLDSLATSCTLTHGMVLRVPSRMYIEAYYDGSRPDPHSRTAIYNDINRPCHQTPACLLALAVMLPLAGIAPPPSCSHCSTARAWSGSRRRLCRRIRQP